MGWFTNKQEWWEPLTLPPDEEVRGEFISGLRKYGVNVTGARMVVTNKALYLNPVNTSGARAFLKILGPIAGMPGVGPAISAWEGSGLTKSIRIPLDAIQSVEPFEPGLLSGPGIKITITDGRTIELMVSPPGFTTIWSSENRPARDQALSLLGAR